MKVTSINQTLSDLKLTAMDAESPSSVRVEGSFIILSYGLTDVYYNDQGREVFTVTLDPPPAPIKPLSRWTRFWYWLTYIQLSPIEQEEIQQWAKHRK